MQLSENFFRLGKSVQKWKKTGNTKAFCAKEINDCVNTIYAKVLILII